MFIQILLTMYCLSKQMKLQKAEIFGAITGTKMTEKTLQKGKNQLDVSSFTKKVFTS